MLSHMIRKLEAMASLLSHSIVMCNLQFLCHRAGFWSAMASNVTFQSRNVLSKKLMVKKEVSELSLLQFSVIM
jgi:hypothetical protein